MANVCHSMQKMVTIMATSGELHISKELAKELVKGQQGQGQRFKHAIISRHESKMWRLEVTPHPNNPEDFKLKWKQSGQVYMLDNQSKDVWESSEKMGKGNEDIGKSNKVDKETQTKKRKPRIFGKQLGKFTKAAKAAKATKAAKGTKKKKIAKGTKKKTKKPTEN